MQGLLWGLLTGDVSLAISVSIVFELLWLDLIPAGTYVPPNNAAANMSALTIVTFFGFSTPAQVIFPILMSLPLAWLASRLDEKLRMWQNAAFNSLNNWVRPGRGDSFMPGRLVGWAVSRSAIIYFLFFTLSITALIALIGILLRAGLLNPPPEMFEWGHLWVAATLGGILSLRSARAYSVLACGFVVVGAAALILF